MIQSLIFIALPHIHADALRANRTKESHMAFRNSELLTYAYLRRTLLQ
jgi:hypothetical protein